MVDKTTFISHIQFMNNYVKPLVLAILFPLIKYSVAALFMLFEIFTDAHVMEVFEKENNNKELQDIFCTADFASKADIISCLLIVAIAYFMRTIDFKSCFNYKATKWNKAWTGILGAVFVVVNVEVLSKVVNFEDYLTDSFLIMSKSLWGVMCLCIIGPLTEELIFRHAIIRFVRKSGVSDLGAIIISSSCFCIVHFNPAQVFFAFFVGVVFAMIYIKTGNIIITTMLHIANNSLYVLLANIYGNSFNDYHLSLYLSFGIMVVLAYPTYKLLRTFWESYDA